MAEVVNILGLVASVDLDYIATPIGGLVTNTGGTDATIPLVDSINAGLMAPGDFDQLNNLVVQTITDGDTTHAPSGDVLFDALALKAPLASPALTGIPTAPTAAPGTNTGQIATTAFVDNVESTIDGNFVHRTGDINESISGSKTFNPSVSAVAGVARGTYINPSLTATANNDALVALDINPSYNNGAFTGVSNLALRVTGSSLFNNFATFAGGLGALSLNINSIAGSARQLFFQTSNVARWIVRASGTAESGGNAGSDFEILNRDDAGNAVSTALFIKRSTGNIVINGITDAGYKLDVNGSTRLRNTLTLEANPTTSAGSFDILTRNTSTGLLEKVLNSGFVHIAGAETITGNKTIATAVDTNGLFVDVLPATVSPAGILVNTKGTTSVPGIVGAFAAASTGNKNAGFIYSPNASGINNKGFFYNKPAGALAGSFAFQLRENNALDLFTVNDLGELNAMKLTKIGGTSVQYLMADGSVSTAANITIPATQVTATPHTDYLVGSNVQVQLDNTETNVVGLYKIDKTDDKTLKQTGKYRPDTDVSVLTISPADTLTITACDNILFVNEILPDSNTNKVPDFLKSFGSKAFVANGTNTPLAANTRGIFYVGLDKLGNQVYRTSKIYDQDVAYLARILVSNTAGTYTIVSSKYIPDLVNNRINNRDRFVLSSGYIVPSGAASISFGNRAMTFTKNSINYSNNKLDPNHLVIADSVNPTPMNFLFFLPNITSLAVNIATSTVMDPTVWYTAGGTAGVGAVNPTHYQVYKLFITVTGTIAIQTKASTVATPDPGVNAIFASREAALAGLTSTIFPDILPAGDSIPLGTFYLRAGMAVNGSTMNDPMDFYFRPIGASTSSSTVGVTVHDNLSGKNDNPAFQHVTTTDISNWNAKPTGSGVLGQVSFWGSSSALTGDSGLFWDNTNKRLGVGITTPISKLQVETLGAVGSGSGEGARISSGSMGVNIGVEATNTYAWIQPSVNGGGYKNIVLNPYGGNVGIGQPSPGAKLDINFNGASQTAVVLNSIDPGAGSGTLRFVDNNDLKWSIITNPSNDFYIFNEDGAGSGYGLFIQKSTNNVGLGNSSPNEKLTVIGNVLASQFIKNGATSTNILLAGGGDIPQSSFTTGGGTTNYVAKWTSSSVLGNSLIRDTGTGEINFVSSSGISYAFINENGVDITFGGYNTVGGTFQPVKILGNGGVPTATFLEGGNVGIGTTNPAFKLDISGADNNGIRYKGASGVQNIIGVTPTIGQIGTTTAHRLDLLVSAVERMSILTNGNVGIGTTTPFTKLDVGGEIMAQVLTVGNQTLVNNNILQITSSLSVPANIQGIKAGVGVTNITMQTAGGNVGIGTTNPLSKLTIAGELGGTVGAGGSNLRIVNTDTGNYASIGAGIVGNTNSGMEFSTDGVQRMVIAGNGNVGIGTTNPTYKLSVNGSVGFLDIIEVAGAGAIGGGAIRFNTDGSPIGLIGSTFKHQGGGSTTDLSNYVYGNNAYSVWTNNVNRFVINGNGNVGIGTTSPEYKFSVFVPKNTTGLFIQNAGVGSPGDYSQIGFGNNGNGNFIFGAIRSAFDNPAGNANTSLQFLTSGDGGLFEGLRISSNGNVGIGTTNPQSKLEVQYSTSLYDSVKSITLTHAEPTNYSGFIGLRQEGLPNVHLTFGTKNAGVDYLNTLNLSNDRVLIGTTNDNGVDKLQVSGITSSNGYRFGNSGNSTVDGKVTINSALFNIHPNGVTYGYGIATNNFGGLDIMANQNSVPIRFWCGTDNSAPTERMRIAGNGNVLIGTTNDYGYKLNVAGTILAGASSANPVGVRLSSDGANGRISFIVGDLSERAAISALDNSGPGNLLFYTSNSNATPTERMRINSDGNVGIGGNPAFGKLELQNNSFGTQTISFYTNDGVANPRAFIQHITSSGSQRVNFTSTYSSTTGVANWSFESGNVLIGTTTDNGVDKLQVNGSIRAQGGLYAGAHSALGGATGNSYNTASLEVLGGGAADTIFPIIGFHQSGLYAHTLQGRSNGFHFMDINGTSRVSIFTANIDASGTVTAAGGFFNSDARLKDVISRDGDVVTFKWKDGRDDKTHVGLIAQEVQEYMPDSVQEGADGMLSVNYIEVLLAKISQLEKRITELENK